MATLVFTVLVIFSPIYVFASSYDPLKISQPSIALEAEQNGFIGLSAGAGGSVHVNTAGNGSVYLDGDDLLFLIEVIESQPPIWESHGQVSGKTPYGYLGEFHAGETIKKTLSAVDPEGLKVTYARVAGDFPPGISLESVTGNVVGIIPDADATYVFTIRATDGHGKYADNVFRMVVRGYDSCSSNPCKHEGICIDNMGDFECDCVNPFGGKTCNLDCRTNPMGIQAGLKYVTDAQMTGYNMYSSYTAYGGRLNGSPSWWGKNQDSYLQIDFRNVSQIHGIVTQYRSTYYYVQYFYMQYSLDGNTFNNFTDYTGNTMRYSGATGSSAVTQSFSQVMTTRFVRIFPLVWYTTSSSYQPAFKVEMYGCYNYRK